MSRPSFGFSAVITPPPLLATSLSDGATARTCRIHPSLILLSAVRRPSRRDHPLPDSPASRPNPPACRQHRRYWQVAESGKQPACPISSVDDKGGFHASGDSRSLRHRPRRLQLSQSRMGKGC
jgi:hypothetical protein